MLVTMKRFKNILIGGVLAFAMLTPALLAANVSAQVSEESKNAACQGLAAGSAGCNDTAGSGVDSLVNTAVDILSWIVGVAAVIMIVFAGFKFITAAGDSSKIASARSTLIYAVIGIAVVVTAQVLVGFVVGEVNGTAGSSNGGNRGNGAAPCIVDAQGNFASNPVYPTPCFMPN